MNEEERKRVMKELSKLEDSIKHTIANGYGNPFTPDYDMFPSKKKPTKRRQPMRNSGTNFPDSDGDVTIKRGGIFITPTNTGFLVFTNPDGFGIQTHCCEDWDGVKRFMEKNTNLDLTQEEVVDNL